MTHDLDKIRLDKWLWAARFYKTRALATEAVSGGKVHLNGERCKAGRNIKIGDCLTITRGHSEMEVIVQGLNKQMYILLAYFGLATGQVKQGFIRFVEIFTTEDILNGLSDHNPVIFQVFI